MNPDRRTFLASGASAVAASALPATAQADLLQQVEQIPLTDLNPYSTDTAIYERIVAAMLDSDAGKRIVERLWFGYTRTDDFAYGERAVILCYSWWRTYPMGPDRIRSAMAGRRMAKLLQNRAPDHPAGRFWGSLFMGAEAISRGLLNAVNLIPDSEKMMNRVLSEHPDYFYYLPATMLGKLYTKAPGFPISVGNLSKAIDYLEAVREKQADYLAVWYLFMAEALHLDGRTEQALALLDDIPIRCKPIDVGTQYTYETTLADAESFRQAIKSGTYNKLTWDPLLEPARTIRTPKPGTTEQAGPGA